MSNPDNDNAQPSGKFRLSLDSATKILAIVLAFVGGAKYFYDKSEAERAGRAANSISYIETYAGTELLAARQAAYDFWIEQEQLIGVLRQERISLRNYEALLEQVVFRSGVDADIRDTLLIFDSFYAQVNFCQSAELCDEGLLDEYFCETAKLDALAYAPFYEKLKVITRDGSIGVGLKNFAEWCVSDDGS